MPPGGGLIKRILALGLPERLPKRLDGKSPPFVVELAVGAGLAALATGVRWMLSPVTGATAPYALVFIAVAIATVAAGWRAGLVAAIVGQSLTALLIIPPASALPFPSGPDVVAFTMATISQVMLLIVIALYQREIDRSSERRERRLELLDEALREIDHRTRNNYQTVLAMIELQSRRSNNPAVREALGQVGERIQAIAKASQQLAAHSADLGAVHLDDHLCGLVEQIGRGLSRDGIDLECEVESVTVSAEKATSISIIVNELVTNAIKHAFNGEGAGQVRVMGRTGSGFEIIVADNGRGIQLSRKDGNSGLGTRLVDSFARQLGARHEVESSPSGTTHRFLIPTLD